MSRTLVDIDDALLAEAREILGARTMKETVNRSLAEVVRLAAARRDLERLQGELGERLGDEELMRGAWR
jgi:Arc/MetJ family transcription regulator